MSIHTKYRYGVWCDHCDLDNGLPSFTHPEAHSEAEARTLAMAQGWACTREEMPRKRGQHKPQFRRLDLCPLHAQARAAKLAAAKAVGDFVSSLVAT